MNEQFVKLMSILIASSNQTQVWHRQTTGPGSFAEHSTLGEYYLEILENIDSLTESYQGKYEILKGYTSYVISDYVSRNEVIKYFQRVDINITELRKSIPDSYLQNQIDAVQELIYSTLYKLKYLS
jgi:hypothetical protein